MNDNKEHRDKSFISPWLSVADGEKAVAFYKSAFNAVETYRLNNDESVIVRLSVNGAEFWISGAENDSMFATPLGANNIRMILITSKPDALFEQALAAGATEIFPVGEDHGWRLGRIADPFGLHWEIGYEV